MMDEATFEELYAATARPLWSYIYRVSGSATQADDLLQETFYHLLRARSLALDKQQLKAYLYKIATNLINDQRRKLKREYLWRLSSAPQQEMYEDSNLDTDIVQILQELKTQERALLWLAYVEGYEHREIATVLNLKEKSVRVLLFRARQKFAGLLKGKGFDPGKRL